MNNPFQLELLSRQNHVKVMLGDLQKGIDELSSNDLKWASIFTEFYNQHNLLTDRQRDVLASIYKRTFTKELINNNIQTIS